MIALLLHDGFYGCGTGAGRSNRALLHILTHHLPDVGLRVMPIHLSPDSPEFDADWHQITRRMVRPGTEIHPLDNGTAGQKRFAGLPQFQTACTDAARHLNALTPAQRPRLIIAVDTPFHGLAPLLLRPLAERLLLVPRSTTLLHCFEDHDRLRWERRGFHTAAQAGGRIAAISTHMRTHLTRDYDLPPATLVDMPNGLLPDIEEPQPTLRRTPPAEHNGFLLAMGRAVAHKGFDDLLDALALLKQRKTVPRLLLAAVTETAEPTTAYQRHLADRMAALNITATLHTRFDPHLPTLLTHPGLRGVVVPSRTEPFGRIPLEAFAAGAAPVVATTAGGLADTVRDGINGFTAPPASPTHLAEAIARALACTEPELDRLRAAGRRTAAAHDYTRNVLNALHEVAPWTRERSVASRQALPLHG